MRAMTQNDDPTAPSLLRELLDQLTHEVDAEAKARREQSEMLEFMHESLLGTEKKGADPIIADAAARIADTKTIVNEVIRDLNALLERIKDTGLRIELLETINYGLLHIYILGNYSTPSEAIWQLHRRQHQAEQIAKAREKLAPEAKERQEKLRAAIISVVKLEELVASSKYAGAIRELVLQRLGVIGDKEWPSERTIERAISAILEDRGKR
jgi:hypothetical protein